MKLYEDFDRPVNVVAGSLAVLEALKYLTNFDKYSIIEKHDLFILPAVLGIFQIWVGLEILIAVIVLFVVNCKLLY